jgi:hypothetical protein
MDAHDHPRYAEWRAALERLIAAQDRLHEVSDWNRETAETEQESALAAYQKICDELWPVAGKGVAPWGLRAEAAQVVASSTRPEMPRRLYQFPAGTAA